MPCEFSAGFRAGDTRLAAQLLVSTAYDSTTARVKAFVEQGGGCRATFFNYRRKLGKGTSDKPSQ